MLIHRALASLVDLLVEQERLVLVTGATNEQVTAELIAALQDQAAFAQAGSFIADVLVASALVDELFADDQEILALISDVRV